MKIDMFTLHFTLVIVSAIMLVVFVVFHRAQPNVKGTVSLAAGTACAVAGSLLMIGRGTLPDPLSVVLPNVLYAGTAALVVRAFRQIRDRSPWSAATLALVVVALLETLIFTYVAPSVKVRVVAMSLILGLPCAVIAVDLFGERRDGMRAAARAVACIYTLYAAAMFARAIGSLMGDEVPAYFGTVNPFHLLGPVVGIVSSIGWVLGFIWLAYGIQGAELRRTIGELSRSNADLDRFASVVSHDLKAPLNTVIGYLGVLRESAATALNPTTAGYLASAEEGAWRMNALIDELLSYSRVREAPLDLRPVDLGQACAAALDNLDARIDRSGAAIEVGHLPAVTADEAQMIRLFQNLIDNALKFRAADRAPKVRVGAERDGNGWTVSVIDNGVGIRPADRERVFELFGRATTTEGREGVGLGLAICRQIVERHDGRLWLEDAPGGGTVFRFALPD